LKLQGSEARDQRPVSNNPPERRSPCSGKFECRGVEPALRNQILPLPHESLSRMETNAQDRANEVIFLAPDAGRLYALGPMWSVFKADGGETANRYSVSEWWLDPHADGPGPHSHEPNEEPFYVIEETRTFQAGEQFIDAPRGSFLRIPAGVTHD